MNTDRLNGWKAIAAYLGKSVRTAYRWEAELNLPVHRIRTPNGEIVYGLKSEIDAWHQTLESTRQDTIAAHSPDRHDDLSVAAKEPVAPPSVASLEPQRAWIGRLLGRFPAISIGALLGMGFAMALGAVRLPRAIPGAGDLGLLPSQPASWRVEGNSLIVFGTAGERLWSRQVPYVLSPARYETEVVAHRRAVAITDLDGDGTKEVLFRVISTDPDSSAAPLYCFEHDGRTRFEFRVSRSVRFGDEVFQPPFPVGDFLVTEARAGRKAIWVRSNHTPWFPSAVHKLTDRGGVLGEYWIPGHIVMMHEAVVAERRVLLVGGCHNDGARASLAVIDAEQPSGSSPSQSASYRCADCPKGSPLAYFIFPRTELTRAPGLRPSTNEVILHNDRFVVSVIHSQPTGSAEPAYITGDALYTFDSRLALVGAEFGDSYVKGHLALERRGVLQHSFGPQDAAQLFPVLSWNGGDFVTLTATARAIPSRGP